MKGTCESLFQYERCGSKSGALSSSPLDYQACRRPVSKAEIQPDGTHGAFLVTRTLAALEKRCNSHALDQADKRNFSSWDSMRHVLHDNIVNICLLLVRL